MKGQNPPCAGTSNGFWNTWHTVLNRSFILLSEISFTTQLLLVWQSSALARAGISSLLFKVLTESKLKQLPYKKHALCFEVSWYFR